MGSIDIKIWHYPCFRWNSMNKKKKQRTKSAYFSYWINLIFFFYFSSVFLNLVFHLYYIVPIQHKSFVFFLYFNLNNLNLIHFNWLKSELLVRFRICFLFCIRMLFSIFILTTVYQINIIRSWINGSIYPCSIDFISFK